MSSFFRGEHRNELVRSFDFISCPLLFKRQLLLHLPDVHSRLPLT